MYSGIESGPLRVRLGEPSSSGYKWLAQCGRALRRRLRVGAEFAYLLLTGPF